MPSLKLMVMAPAHVPGRVEVEGIRPLVDLSNNTGSEWLRIKRQITDLGKGADLTSEVIMTRMSRRKWPETLGHPGSDSIRLFGRLTAEASPAPSLSAICTTINPNRGATSGAFGGLLHAMAGEPMPQVKRYGNAKFVVASI